MRNISDFRFVRLASGAFAATVLIWGLFRVGGSLMNRILIKLGVYKGFTKSIALLAWLEIALGEIFRVLLNWN